MVANKWVIKMKRNLQYLAKDGSDFGDCLVRAICIKPVWYCQTTVTPMGLKRARERRGLTVKQVSEATGIPQSTLSQYENGKRKPKSWVLEKMSDYYGVDQKILIFRGKKGR